MPGRAGWKDVAAQLQRPLTMPLVDYAATGGGAKVYSPNVADQTSLTNTWPASGVKSCTFDLGNINDRRSVSTPPSSTGPRC